MKRRGHAYVLVSAAMLVITPLSFGRDADPCKTQNNTPEINACASSRFAEADRKLNSAYANVMKVLRDTAGPNQDSQTPKLLLIKAQRRWIEFRDAECRAESALMEGGTARTSDELTCKADLTEQRIRVLDPSRWMGN